VLPPCFSEALCAGEEAGSRVRFEDGVAGEDFWKNPRMDFWLRMFCVFGVARFSAGDDAGGDEADALAIIIYNIEQLSILCIYRVVAHELIE
jgi:hypothetical protein